MSNTRRTTSCGDTVPFQRFCLSLNATSKRDVALQPLELAAEPERDRAARVAPVLADAEAQVLALADRRGADRLAAGDEQRHVGIAEPERRELLELAGELERQRRRGNDRVDPGDRRQILVDELRVGVGGERGGERLELVAADRQARRRHGGRRSARDARRRRRGRRGGRSSAPICPEPFQRSPSPAIRTTGRPKRSTSREATIPITPSCQPSPQTT